MEMDFSFRSRTLRFVFFSAGTQYLVHYLHQSVTTMSSRQLHLNVNLLHSGVYASAWRLPESDPRACFDVGHYVRVAQIAERGRAKAEIAAKNRDLETLLYVTSHDLREPLRAIDHSEQYLRALFGGPRLKAVETLSVLI